MAKEQAEKQPGEQASTPEETVDPLWLFERIVKKGEDGQPEVDYVELNAALRVLTEHLGSEEEALWGILRCLGESASALKGYYGMPQQDERARALAVRKLHWACKGMYEVAKAIAPEVWSKRHVPAPPDGPENDPESWMDQLWGWFVGAWSALEDKWKEKRKEERIQAALRWLIKLLMAKMTRLRPPLAGWSKPLTVKQWAEVFDCEWHTMKQWLVEWEKEGDARRVGKQWMVAVDVVPESEREKVEPASVRQKPERHHKG